MNSSASLGHRKQTMNPILLRLTKLHIRLVGGRFVRTQTMRTPNGVEQEVTVFSSDKPMSVGQCTPIKTIIIHESVLENEQLSDYVLIHEMAHKKQWWSFFAIPLCILVIFGFFSLVSAFMFLIQSLISMNPSYLLGFAGFLVAFVLALIIPCAFSWMMELNADFAAIKQMGLEAFVGVRDELRKTHKLTASWRIISWLTHPPLGITVRAWRWRHKQE